MADSNITVELKAKIDDLQRKLNQAERDLKDFERGAKNSNKGAEDSFKKLSGVIAGAFAIDRIVSVTKAMINITATFEKYNAVLTNTLGSQEAASASLKQLQSFAAVTPFSVDELTSSYIKLANQGFLATRVQLTKLGDLASSTGKSFDQLTEAILDAQQGEYERLKEFGIRAKDNGDTVIFTFKGIQTEVDKTSNAIRNYITELGGAEGVTGSMAAISKTLTGQLSNLGDSWDAVLVSFGNRTSGVFKTAIENLNKFLQRIAEVNTNIENTQKVGGDTGFWKNWVDGVKNLYLRINGMRPQQSMTDAIGGQVTADREEFEKLASDLTANAKSAKDFEKAIAAVNTEFTKYASRVKSAPQLYKSLELAKDNAIALIAAQKKAFEQNAQGGANFGKSKKEKTGFALLQEQLSSLEEQLQNSIIAGKVGANDYDSPLVRRVNAARKAIEDYKLAADSVQGGLMGAAPANTQGIISGTDQPFGGEDAGLSGLKKWQAEANAAIDATNAVNRYYAALEKEKELMTNISNVVGSGLTSAFENLVNGTQSAIQSIGQFLQQLVSRILAAAAAAAVLAGIFSIFGFGGGFGGAASATGSFKNLFNNFSGVTAFAKGGIISGPTLALMGEAGESEVVAPLSKFNQMVNERASSNNTFVAEPMLLSNGLLIKWISRANTQNNRTS